MLNTHNYNPDVLSCIANLSSDEVFTPPKMANAILDLLPQDIWKDKSINFLDPFSKSGVFLREIARRLDNGSKKKFQTSRNGLIIYSANRFMVLPLRN